MGEKMKKICLALLMVLATALAACGPGNTVRLLPAPPIDSSALPAPNAPSVSVVCFTDNMTDPEIIGKRRDGSAFTTSNDVPEWISRALADDLARRGMRVTFAMDTSQARSSKPDFLVTGVVEQIWLSETSAVELSAQLRVKCTLANRKGKIWTETTNSSQTTGGLLTAATAENLLRETMRGVIQPVAAKIMAAANMKK